MINLSYNEKTITYSDISDLKTYKETDVILHLLSKLSINMQKYITYTLTYEEWYEIETGYITRKGEEGAKFFLVYGGNIPIGIILFNYNFSNNQKVETKEGYIKRLYIDKKYRSFGIGEILIKKVEDYFKTLNIELVNVGSMHNNIKANKLYERLQYKFYKKSQSKPGLIRFRKNINIKVNKIT